MIAGTCVSCGESFSYEMEDPELTSARILLKRSQEAARRGELECESCEGTRERKEAAEELLRVLELRRIRAGLPLALRGLTFDAVEEDAPRTDAIRLAKSWAANGGGILLWGDVGVGKTRIAAAATEELIKRGIPVRWVPVAKLLTDMRLPFGHKDYAAAQEALRPAKPGEALILDDLDKATGDDRSVQPLYVAIDGWVNAEAPLFVTLNRHLDRLADDFGERYGDAIASRLVGYCEDVNVGGPDRRLPE